MDENAWAAALERSRAETSGAFANRALLYAHIDDVLTEEFGPERSAELMKRAIRRRGVEIGAKYRDAVAAGDLTEVGRLFCEGSPCEGTLFEPGVESAEEGRLVLRMTECALVDAWRAAGLPPERVDRLCDIAAAVDEGTFEGAGLDLRFLERLAQPDGCRCLLELRLRD